MTTYLAIFVPFICNMVRKGLQVFMDFLESFEDFSVLASHPFNDGNQALSYVSARHGFGWVLEHSRMAYQDKSEESRLYIVAIIREPGQRHVKLDIICKVQITCQ